MRALADVYGARWGAADEQLRLLKRVLELMPQAKDVREYVAHIEPSKPRAGRSSTRAAASEFLAEAQRPGRRSAPAHARRPAGDDGLPERPGEPLPPGRLPAADRRGRGRGARVRLRLRDRQRGRAAPRRPRVPAGRQGRRGRSRAAKAAADDPAIAHVHERARLLRPLPAARRRATSSSSTTAWRTSPPRNAFADYFGEVDYMQSERAGRRAPSTCSSPRRAARSTSTSPHVPGLKQTTEEKGDQRIYHFVAENVAADGAGAAAAAVDRGARARARLDLQVVGRDGPLVLGPRQGPVRRRTTRCAAAPRS